MKDNKILELNNDIIINFTTNKVKCQYYSSFSLNFGGFLSKIKNFFGKGKNLAVGAAASTMLGLGPFPGIIAASMYNKKKYKKNKDQNEALDNTIENAKDKQLSKTAESPEAKEQRKKNKEYIKHVEQAREAEASGNVDKANKMEKALINKAKSDGDIETPEKAQSLVSGQRDFSSYGSANDSPKNPKSEGLFSKLGGLLTGLGSMIVAAILGLRNLSNGEYVDAGGNVNKGNVAGTIGGAAGFVGSKLLSKLPIVGKYFKNTGAITGTVGYASKMAGEIADGDTDEAVISGAYLAKNAYNLTKNTKLGKKISTKAGKVIAKTAPKVATTVVSKLGISIGKMLKSLSKNGLVQRFAPKLASKLASSAHKIGSWVGKLLAGSAKKGAKAAAMTTANTVADAIPIANIVVNVVFALGGFINGWNNVRNILSLSPNYKVPTSLKFTSAIVGALDASLGNGILDLFSVRDDIITFIYKLFASEEEEAKFKQAQNGSGRKIKGHL